MNCYLEEIRGSNSLDHNKKNAGGKARWDVSKILSDLKMDAFSLRVREEERNTRGVMNKISWHGKAFLALKKALRPVSEHDRVFIQFPLFSHSFFNGFLFSFFKLKKIQLILIVHDLETLRQQKETEHVVSKVRNWTEEIQALHAASFIIVHNETMKRYLEKSGIPARKMISLEIFDYLLPVGEPFDQTRFKKNAGVIVAGNLERKKSGYLYSLPEQVHWNLYGVGYADEGKSNIAYKGSFLPEELIAHLEGGFGLVWDGPSAETCTGIYGDYLRINNPHKTSLYLAAGLPVIIWKEAALASFVEENGVGVTVSSLYEIKEAIDSISDAEYEQMKLNARRVGMRLREGYYLRSAIEKI